MRRVELSDYRRAYHPACALGMSLLLLALCALLLSASPVFAQTISGRAETVDGDTLIIDEARIRLNAVDAPETDQTCLNAKSSPYDCGIMARDRLRAKIGQATVTCISEGEDRYGRTLATCQIENENLNRWLVTEGLAIAYVQYSSLYVADEAEARKNQRGLWSGAFTAPWDWRHRTPDTPLLGIPAQKADKTIIGNVRPATPPVAECAIKGNVNRHGERIYFLHGNSAYGKVRMDKGMGERWFCSEHEAVATGWRKALNTR
jgi:endonuclease YncB( thermonuclease family)